MERTLGVSFMAGWVVGSLGLACHSILPKMSRLKMSRLLEKAILSNFQVAWLP